MQISILLRCECVFLSIEPLLNFFLCREPLIQHHTFLRLIPVPVMEPFVGLRGPNPGSELFAPTKKTLTASPFVGCGA